MSEIPNTDTSVLCPLCGAEPSEACVTATGREARGSHAIRVQLSQSAGPRPLTLEADLVKAITASHWLRETDDPKVTAALLLARQIDRRTELERGTLLEEFGGGKGSTYDLEVYGRLLDSLGFSPRGRLDLGIEAPDSTTNPMARVVRLVEEAKQGS